LRHVDARAARGSGGAHTGGHLVGLRELAAARKHGQVEATDHALHLRKLARLLCDTHGGRTVQASGGRRCRCRLSINFLEAHKAAAKTSTGVPTILGRRRVQASRGRHWAFQHWQHNGELDRGHERAQLRPCIVHATCPRPLSYAVHTRIRYLQLLFFRFHRSQSRSPRHCAPSAALGQSHRTRALRRPLPCWPRTHPHACSHPPPPVPKGSSSPPLVVPSLVSPERPSSSTTTPPRGSAL
jgi:hypothetical protein